MRHDLDLVITLADRDEIAEVPRAPVDLDSVLEELLEGGDIEDLVGCGCRAVNGVL